jgi:DNA-binding SARP family transcriptional activator
MAKRLIELTPYLEVTVRKYIQSYISSGDRASATKVLSDWKVILAKDLDRVETRTIEDFT